jgi:hypothetical protein
MANKIYTGVLKRAYHFVENFRDRFLKIRFDNFIFAFHQFKFNHISCEISQTVLVMNFSFGDNPVL